MVTLKQLNSSNFETCINLKVQQVQRRFIASNAYSLAQAYAETNDSYTTALPFAVYHEDKVVGFVMVHYQPVNPNDEDDTETVYYISRVMIDGFYQGKGFGKAAFLALLDYLKTMPLGKAEAIVLSCNEANTVAFQLFISHGFTRMGIKDDDGDDLLRIDL